MDDDPPEATRRDDLVLSVSAGLAAKDFRFLVESMAELDDFERMILVARSNGLEDVPDMVERLVAEFDPSIGVRVNVATLRGTVLHGRSDRPPLHVVTRREDGASHVRDRSHAVRDDSPCCPTGRSPAASVGERARTVPEPGRAARGRARIAPAARTSTRSVAAPVSAAQRYREPAVLTGLHSTLQEQLTRWRAQRL